MIFYTKDMQHCCLHYKKVKMKFVFGILALTLGIATLWGWILNIVELINMDFMAHIGLGITRVIGIFMAPLGAILGFFV